jgi:hypothetical protein
VDFNERLGDWGNGAKGGVLVFSEQSQPIALVFIEFTKSIRHSQQMKKVS